MQESSEAHRRVVSSHGHATTPAGCSRNTCTSSHSTWYVVTWIFLHDARIAGTGHQEVVDVRAARQAAAAAPASATVSRPSSRAAEPGRHAVVACRPAMPGPCRSRARSPARPAAGAAGEGEFHALAAAIAVTVATSEVSEMAGSAGLPTITGCANYHGHMLGVGARAAAAERDELAPAVEPGGHVPAGRGHLPGLRGELAHRLFPAAEQGVDLGRPGGGHDGPGRRPPRQRLLDQDADGVCDLEGAQEAGVRA